ncbi:hypothetical protein NE659_27515, partial [Flavonifractor plautii]|nr:hypothetical protein [Flavonifractor plautii]
MAEDKAQAVEWYTRAAEGGYAPAQTNLAYCFLTGIGMEAAPEKAIPWLEKAAEQGQAGGGGAGAVPSLSAAGDRRRPQDGGVQR